MSLLSEVTKILETLAPRTSAVAKVNRTLAPYRATPGVRAMAETSPGTAYELVQTMENKAALTQGNRVPHVIDLDTGSVITGSRGTFHRDLLDEHRLKSPNKLFIGEFPDHISFDIEGRPDVSPDQLKQAVTIAQKHFPDKPIVVAGKVFGATAMAGSLLGASQSHAQTIIDEPTTDEDYVPPEGTQVPSLLDQVSATMEEQDLASQVSQLLAEDKSTGSPLLDEHLKPYTELSDRIKGWSGAEGMTEDQIHDMIFQKLGAIPGATVGTTYEIGKMLLNMIPNPERIAAGVGELGFDPHADVLSNPFSMFAQPGKGEDVANAAMDLVMLDGVVGSLGKWLKPFPKVVAQTKPLADATDEVVSKAYTQAMKEAGFHEKLRPTPKNDYLSKLQEMAIKEDGTFDAELRAQQLEFEYKHFYDLDKHAFAKYEADKKLSGLMAQEDVSRASTLSHAGPGNVPMTAPKPYNAAYESFQPGVHGTDLFPDVPPSMIAETAHPITTQIAKETNRALDFHVPLDSLAGTEMKQTAMRGLVRKAFTSTITALRQVGPVGKEVARRFLNYYDIPEVLAARKMANITPFLRKFSKAEEKNFVDVMDNAYYNVPDNPELFKWFKPNVRPISPKVQQAVDATLPELMETWQQANAVNLGITQNPRGFFSHVLTSTKLKEQAIVKHLLKTKQAANPSEAIGMAREYARKYMDHRFAGLEQARTFHLNGYDALKETGHSVKPEATLYNYFLRSHRRIQGVIEFGNIEKAAGAAGKDSDAMRSMIQELRKYSDSHADIAESLWMRSTGQEKVDPLVRAFIKGATTANVITLMGVSAPLQLGQSARMFMKLGVEGGLKGTYKGLKGLFNKTTRHEAERTGAMYQSFVHDYGTEMSKVSDKFLHVTGVSQTDAMTRMMAAHGAQSYIDDMTRALSGDLTHTNWTIKKWERAAEEIGIDRKWFAERAETGLSQLDRDLLTKRLTDASIGRVRPIDLPLWWSHPYAQFFTLFKHFTMENTKFMWNNLVKETAKGNLKPLALYGMVGIPVGEVVGDIRAALKNKQRPTGMARVIDNLAFIQGLGLFQDAALAAQYGTDRLWSFAGGPSVSFGVNTLGPAVRAMAAGDMDKLKPAWKEVIKRFTGMTGLMSGFMKNWALMSTYPEDQARSEDQPLFRR